MTPLERTLAALSQREGDRPPVFLLPTMHGAKELGLSLRDYFSTAQHLVEGQVRLQRKFGHDCYYAFFHAALELEAWGGSVLYREDGPPNAGEPIFRRFEELTRAVAPRIDGTPVLEKVLTAIHGLATASAGRIPIFGVVISPFSAPVMQLGFSSYLDLLLDAQAEPHGARAAQLAHLLAQNEDFAVRWGNAQLAAGATAVVYFDPLSSTTVTDAALGEQLGLVVARRVIGQYQGPAAIHFASGRILSRLETVLATGARVVGVSAEEDLGALKQACAGRAVLLGNLNGIQMARWTPEEAAAEVRRTLDLGAPGGGFALADNHGEIPFQVEDRVLHAIVEAADAWGRERTARA